MGALYSYFFGASDKEEADPSSGLTATQINMIRQCWEIVEQHKLEIGVEIMISFLRAYPEHQDEFPKFKRRDLEELANDRHFHAHCLNIMGTFSQAVQFLHDPELCIAGLHMAGTRHGHRGQQVLPFDLLQPMLTKILKDRLGAKCTTEVSQALDIALDVIFTTIRRGILDETKKPEAS